jgi:hypothetical protein
MAAITDRYASAVRSSDLSNKAEPDATISTDSDVVGAFGLAGKRNPLAVALTRLFTGDNGASTEVVAILSSLAWGKADAMRVQLKRTQADDMARAVLAWHREGHCRACNGHGYELIPGAPSLSGSHCSACDGTRKVPFAREFGANMRGLAFWLLGEVEREQSVAGPAAMAKLGPRL